MEFYLRSTRSSGFTPYPVFHVGVESGLLEHSEPKAVMQSALSLDFRKISVSLHSYKGTEDNGEGQAESQFN